MTDNPQVFPVCADYQEYVRTMVNIAREADEYDRPSIRRAQRLMAEVRTANPEFAARAAENFRLSHAGDA